MEKLIPENIYFAPIIDKKIYFISVWRLMPKAFEGLLRYVILAQSTPISYYTEGLVKTEVMSTVRLDFHYLIFASNFSG